MIKNQTNLQMISVQIDEAKVFTKNNKLELNVRI